jgi:hypothetical protein
LGDVLGHKTWDEYVGVANRVGERRGERSVQMRGGGGSHHNWEGGGRREGRKREEGGGRREEEGLHVFKHPNMYLSANDMGRVGMLTLILLVGTQPGHKI